MTRMTLDMMNNCPFGYDYVINGDLMLAGVFCGSHFLYMVELI